MIIRPSLLALILRFWLPLLLVCGYAAKRGGKPERWAAALILAAVVLTALVRVGFDQRYGAVQPAVAVIDAALFVAMVALAVYANRRWPILLAALHAIPLLGHFARWLDPDLPKLAYAILLSGPQIPIMLVLFVGTVRHQRRIRQWRVDADWSRSSGRRRTHRSSPAA